MSLELDDCRAELLRAAPALADFFDGCVAEAARSLTPAGRDDWLEGARGLARLGRGPEVLRAWLEHLPAVARECGEDVIADVSTAAMRLASLTSGAVIAQMFDTLPTAARRLADPALLRGYLGLLHRLAAQAPRGLRPMLGCVDELLGKLTLSGLVRWVDFGAEAYRRDLAGQAAYFALATKDSRAVLERERRGTLFVDCQRRLNLYLRAFWARDFCLRPASAQDAGFRPFVAGGALHLPDAVDALPGIAGLDIYRAMAAHLAAHVVHTRVALSPEGLSPMQQFLVGLLEDARVEHCAIRTFPGLKRLWQRLLPASFPRPHPGQPSLELRPDDVDSDVGTGADADVAAKADAGAEVDTCVALLERTASVLLDGAAPTGDAAVDALVRRFRERLAADCEDAMTSLVLGLELFELLEARGPLPSLRVLEGRRPPYRDDNRLVWHGAAIEGFHEAARQPDGPRQTRRRVSLMEFVNGLDVETAGDDAQEVWVLDGVLYDDDGVTWNEREGREPVSEPRHYPEWDYRVPGFRPDWTTVYEHRAPRGDAALIDRLLAARKPLVSRIRRIVERLRPQGVIRERKLEDGDELDLNAAVDAAVALRTGRQPDSRIAMHHRLRRRDVAVLVLLDLSESTNETVPGSSQTVLDLTREACALVSTVIAGIGDPFAVHGFCSDGRDDVRYVRFKDFDARFDADVKARLAAMQGGLSTRMGAAMRHAATHLARQPARRKLLLVVTDGEPADIDERDPQVLRHDARKAVEELHARGIATYCLTLDARADSYVDQIFGRARHTIVEAAERLPERLPLLFAGLTR